MVAPRFASMLTAVAVRVIVFLAAAALSYYLLPALSELKSLAVPNMGNGLLLTDQPDPSLAAWKASQGPGFDAARPEDRRPALVSSSGAASQEARRVAPEPPRGAATGSRRQPALPVDRRRAGEHEDFEEFFLDLETIVPGEERCDPLFPGEFISCAAIKACPPKAFATLHARVTSPIPAAPYF